MALEIIPEDGASGMLSLRRTMPKILCCKCGVEIESNPANMCIPCLQGEVDITAGIPKQVILHQCRGCARFLRPGWVAAELESATLLAICLKKINGLSKVHLVDACFLWTEPHSRRLKVKLTIQKEVLRGARVQQVFPVEFLLQNQQCDTCQRSYTDHTWRALIQARQKVDHKRTFFLLEQLILKYRAHEKCINVEQVPAGVDFAFTERSHAMKFMDFLGSVVPIRSKSAKQLISEDIQNGDHNFKFTFAVELVPLCRDDLVVLPARTAASLGSISPLSLVQRVGNHIFFVDPRTLQMAEMTAEKYWHDPFRALMTVERLEEFTVLDVTPVTIAPLTGAALRRKQKGRRGRGAAGGSERASDPRVSGGSDAGSVVKGVAAGEKRRRASGENGPMDDMDDASSTMGASSVAGGRASRAGGYTGAVSLAGGSIAFHGASSVASTVTGGPKGRMLLSDVEVMKTRDMGVSDRTFIVRSHLGNLLRAGDLVMGYDLTNAVYNDMDAETNATGGKSRTKGTAGRGADIDMPDVVLVKKSYPRKGDKPVGDSMDYVSAMSSRAERRAASRAATAGPVEGETEMTDAPGASAAGPTAAAGRRIWKLKRFDDVVPTTHSDVVKRGDEERAAAQYEAFLREIEEDPMLRKSINLYKDQEALEARKAALAAATAVAATHVRFVAAAAAPAAASAANRSNAVPGIDEDADDDEEAGGVEYEGGDIDLAELLDDMTIGDASAAAAAAARSAADNDDDAPVPEGAYVDPEDAAVLAATRAARKRAAAAAAAYGAPDASKVAGEWETHTPSRTSRATARAAVNVAAAVAATISEDEEEADDAPPAASTADDL